MYLEINLIKLAVSNSRCTCIAWVPGGDGTFVVAHADGNLYVYEKASPEYWLKDDFYFIVLGSDVVVV